MEVSSSRTTEHSESHPRKGPELGQRHLGALLEAAAELHGEGPCFAGDDGMTYRELSARVAQLAAWLRRSGVAWGDRAVIVAAGSPEVAVAAFAVARVGGIFSVLHPATREAGLAAILAQVRPSVVFLDPMTAHLAPGIRDALLVGLDGAELPERGIALETALSAEERDVGGLTGSEDDPVCLVYTSGSTGAPRGVTLTHGNILFAIAGIQERLGYRPDDLIGVFLPLSFDYGLYQIFLAVQAGASLLIRSELAGPDLVRLLAEHRVTVLPVVPSLGAGLLKLLARNAGSLPGLRCITNTGAHLPQSQVDELRRRLPHISLFPMYGLTECKRVSILRPEEIDAKPGTVGRPLAGTEVWAEGEDGTRLPPGEAGELVVRGPHVSLGYWQAPAETAVRFRPWGGGAGRVLYTGDRGRVDADGFLEILGRMDAIFKRNGFRLHPAEIEDTAGAIPGVLEAGLCLAGTDRLCLFVTLAAGMTGTEVLRELQQRLEPFKVPNEIRVLEEMPRTRNRKIDREALAALAQAPERR